MPSLQSRFKKIHSNKTIDDSLYRPTNIFLTEVEGELICVNCGDLIPKDCYCLQGENGVVLCIVCAVSEGLVEVRPNTFTEYLFLESKSWRKR